MTGERKKRITASIAIHEVQANIIEGLQSGKIDLRKHTLLDIAKIIKCKDSAQMIKHHLGALVKLGVLQIINAEYQFTK